MGALAEEVVAAFSNAVVLMLSICTESAEQLTVSRAFPA